MTDHDETIRITKEKLSEIIAKAIEGVNQAIKAENERYRKALEFYASVDNWYMSSRDESLEICNTDRRTVDLTNPDQEITVGGLRARRALKGRDE